MLPALNERGVPSWTSDPELTARERPHGPCGGRALRYQQSDVEGTCHAEQPRASGTWSHQVGLRSSRACKPLAPDRPAARRPSSHGAVSREAGDTTSWRAEDWQWDSVKFSAIAVEGGPGAAEFRQRGHARTHFPACCEPSAGSDSPADQPGAQQPSNDSGGGGTSAGPGAVGAAAPAGWPAGGKLPKSICQADGCGQDLTQMTFYHQRNRSVARRAGGRASAAPAAPEPRLSSAGPAALRRICAVHTKADVFERDGVQMRFCQRCGRSHPLGDFDPGKHSCR